MLKNFKGQNPQGKPVGEFKRCSTCKQIKNRETEFYMCYSRRDKRQNSCIPCAVANMHKQKANPQTFTIDEHTRRVAAGVAKV